jgi:hypothetical protein
MHVNHRHWTAAPCISFTDSPVALEELADMRVQNPKRRLQTVVAMIPGNQLRNGLPILNFVAESEFYEINNPSGTSNNYFDDHYLYLWEVSEREFLVNGNGKRSAKSTDNSNKVVVPVFGQHTIEKTSRIVEQGLYSATVRIIESVRYLDYRTL